jgi:hypothetical protein
MPEVRERPPHIGKASMVAPLVDDTGFLGARTTFLEDVDGAP